MYRTDAATRETKFEMAGPSAREVFLECFNEQNALRVPMKRAQSRWTVRLALPMGLFFYRFHVDGRPCWDRDSGKVNAGNGVRYSLALINR